MSVRIERMDDRRVKCVFPCPLDHEATGDRIGRECWVMLKPWPVSDDKTWAWDGNESAPTLSPSIQCVKCGWHGHIVAGRLANA